MCSIMLSNDKMYLDNLPVNKEYWVSETEIQWKYVTWCPGSEDALIQIKVTQVHSACVVRDQPIIGDRLLFVLP